MLNHIASFIREKALFSPTDQLLLAVSGGMDSMVLLHVLLALGYEPGVVHCNFQLRGEAANTDEAFVQEAARKQGLDFYSRRFATEQYAEEQQCSIQVAARELRYAYFTDLLREKGYQYLLTAHHLDDRIETFWLNFTRGTGWRGLASLQAKRNEIRRPLLSVNRQQIADYQEAHQVPYREDESNAEDKYRRNYFRHHVLSALYEWTPDLKQRSSTNFQQLEEMLLLYQERIEEYRDQLFKQTKKGETQIDLLALRKHPAAATLSWEMLSPLGFDREQTRQFVVAKAGTLLHANMHTLLVEDNSALLVQQAASTEDFILNWEENEKTLTLENQLLSQTLAPVPPRFTDNPQLVWINPTKLIWPLTVRYWQEGDRFAPLGMKGRQQKLQDFFVNNKVNRLQRQKVPLLVNGDGAIIWVIGYRIDERFKVLTEMMNAISFALRTN